MAIHQVDARAEKPVHVDKRKRDGKARAKACSVHGRGFFDQSAGGWQRLLAVPVGGFQVAALHLEHLARQAVVFGAADQLFGALAVGVGVQAHVGGESSFQLRPAVETHGVRKAHQGRGRALRPCAHVAHGAGDHLVGVVQHVAGHLL